MALAIPPREMQGDDDHLKKKQDQNKYTTKKQDWNNTYTDHILEQVEKEKRVTVDCNLSFEHHIMEKVGKANQMMGLIRRSFVYLDEDKDCTKQ